MNLVLDIVIDTIKRYKNLLNMYIPTTNKWEIKFKICTALKFYITLSLNRYINLREIIRHLNKWIIIFNLKIRKMF